MSGAPSSSTVLCTRPTPTPDPAQNGNLTRWQWNPKGGPADLSNLSPAAYSGTPVVGTGTVVSGPSIDGQNWVGLDTFVYAGAEGAPNAAPVAAATSQCTDNSCVFDASTSTDSDGTIVSYVWDFGDDTTSGAGQTAAHVYAAGTYTATLTVVDNDGALDTETLEVTATLPNQPPTADITAELHGSVLQPRRLLVHRSRRHDRQLRLGLR